MLEQKTFTVFVKDRDPLLNKLFHDDVVTTNETNEIHVISSTVRDNPFPAVLVLNGGKTFGRTITNSGKQGRLLYQCVPDNPHLPIFLVPYDIKPDFSKVVKNKYVIVKFDHWHGSHPQGILDAVLGNVDEYLPFSEYQLYCRNLIKLHDKAFAEFTKAARQWKSKSDDEPWIRSHLANPAYKIADLTHIDNIVSVDPSGCEDIDDAFSIMRLPDQMPEQKVKVSIYIANVPLWLSVLDLWQFIEGENRITTVYLPDRKVPMLPTVLSEDLCSLKAGKLRYSFVMHATFKAKEDKGSEGTEGTDSPRDLKGTFELESVTYENALINVKTNYAYEDKKLLKSADYILLKQIAASLDDASDSHEVVATFMKFMNSHCAETLAKMNTGIFRNQKGSTLNSVEGGTLGPCSTLNSAEGRTLGPCSTSRLSFGETLSATGTFGPHRTLNSAEGGILSATYGTINEGHAHLGLTHYTHITSPIRRIVDLINMRFMMNFDSIHPVKESAIEKINKMSKSAKKAQMDCELYSKVLGADPETIYTGTIVDIDVDSLGRETYIVYLEELKTYARTKEHLNTGSGYKIHLFDDEHSLRRKIRVECVEK